MLGFEPEDDGPHWLLRVRKRGWNTLDVARWLGGQAGVRTQVEIGDGARVAVRGGVTRDVPAGETVSGYPARPHREALQREANVSRIPRLVERIRRLEADAGRSADEG